MSLTRTQTPTGWRRLIARATARGMRAFVVPDARLARQAGLDLDAAGVRVASSPRHASLLLVVGDLPPGLLEAATVVYAQMPRPRAILALGAGELGQLPPADVVASLDQAGLESGMARVRDLITARAVSVPDEPFTAPVLEQASGADEGMDHSSHSGHGGMDHGDQGDAGHEDHQDHQAMNHGDRTEPEHGDHEAMDHGGHADGGHGETDHDMSGMDHDHEGMEQDHGEMGHGSMDHSMMGHDMSGMDHSAMGHDMSGMDHGAMGHDMSGGFMSMVAMTKDLPRSPDGLPMEWVEAPFGPLFPGLPAGLAPTLTLDGDTVVSAELRTVVTHRAISESLPGPAESFPDRLAALDPFAPASYRLLAMRGLIAAGMSSPDETGALASTRRERAASHLGWLSDFLSLLGLDRLHDRAASLHLDLLQALDIASVARLQPPVDRLLRDVERTPLLRRRLAGIGVLQADDLDGVSGPVARASGIAPEGDEVEASLLREGGDAWDRLNVRLEEIRQALDAVTRAGTLEFPRLDLPPHLSGSGMASVETPRGMARLHLDVAHGQVRVAHVEVPSTALGALVPRVVEQAELGDALVAIASLDISPWEMDQ